MERSRILGRRLYLALAALRDELPVIGDVRGKGFMLGMELVSDKVRDVSLHLPCPSSRYGVPATAYTAHPL